MTAQFIVGQGGKHWIEFRKRKEWIKFIQKNEKTKKEWK